MTAAADAHAAHGHHAEVPHLVDDAAAHRAFCYDCGLPFATVAAWKMRSTMKHGFRAPLEGALHSIACLAYLMEFHSTDRLLQHLKARGGRCGALVLQHVGAASPDIVAGVRARAKEEAARRKTARLNHLPAYRLCGPLPPWAI